jgi:hypothetical protein
LGIHHFGQRDLIERLFSIAQATIPFKDEASDKLCGLWSLFADANAFIIVCRGIDSTDKAFFLWLWKLWASLGANAGDEGNDVESVPGLTPTVGESKALGAALLVVEEEVVF